MRILLDAMAAVGLLEKSHGEYSLPAALLPFLAEDARHSVTPMLRHQANCLRRWAQLARVVQSGETVDVGPSIRGPEGDNESFIEAMDVVSAAMAGPLVTEVYPGSFRCLLDVGGASGTWTRAWLQTEPTATAILFDLPAVIPLARHRLEQGELAERVQFASGDYNRDPLPRGADLVWLSAIIHQNSRAENRALFKRISDAIDPDGVLLIRDIVLAESRTEPTSGALFAVNMLVGTQGGDSYTLGEISEDLAAANFTDVKLVRHDAGMHSVVAARFHAAP